MNKLRKILLMAMAMLPISSIAIASESRVLDITADEQNKLLLAQLNRSKGLLFPKGVNVNTVDGARLRIKKLTGIQDEKILEMQLQRHIGILQKEGILILKGDKIISSSPSRN